MGVTAWRVVEMKGDVKQFTRRKPYKGGNETADIADAEEYLTACIKQNGTADLNLGSPTFAGPNDFKHHLALLKYLYLRSFELMGVEPEQPWNEKKLPEMKRG